MLLYKITLSILAQTFYTCVSTYKFCLLKLFSYCEYMLQNLTYAFLTNRFFVIIRMDFIASPPSELSLYYFITSLWHLSFSYSFFTIQIPLLRIFLVLHYPFVLQSSLIPFLILENFYKLQIHLYYLYIFQ